MLFKNLSHPPIHITLSETIPQGQSFWAHLCLCTVGSYASLSAWSSVCLLLHSQKELAHWTVNVTVQNYACCKMNICQFLLQVCKSAPVTCQEVAYLWVICRWAHFNVKLNFLRVGSVFLTSPHLTSPGLLPVMYTHLLNNHILHQSHTKRAPVFSVVYSGQPAFHPDPRKPSLPQTNTSSQWIHRNNLIRML